jgi:hypothetical protein
MTQASETAAPIGRLRTEYLVEAAAVLLGASLLVCLLFWDMPVAIGSVIGKGSDAPGTVSWLYALQHEGGYRLFGQTHHT